MKQSKGTYLVEKIPAVYWGIICGIYPFLFYVSNNFYATNSWENWGFYVLFFIGISVSAFSVLFLSLHFIKKLQPYKNQLLFVTIIVITAFLTSFASSLTIKKKLLLGILVIAFLLSLKLKDQYKRLAPLILIVSILPLLKLGYKIYDQVRAKTWLQQPDSIENVQFSVTPNVYMIQPDGYASRSAMESEVYHYDSSLYNWLEGENFIVYDDFRSNYPASLNSNASLFAMRHHYFGSKWFPDLEMPYAREVISGNNPVVNIFKNNGYETFFIAEDEYFQQNRCEQLYDHFNIPIDDIPYFGRGGDLKQDVLGDVKEAFQKRSEAPAFFFIEKCVPHHVHFSANGDRVAEERKEYLEKIEEVNGWLRETIQYITQKDPNGIIIVLADHGGWVGLENYGQMFRTQQASHINSIYAALCAIKWNGLPNWVYDRELDSNVNVFRVLFSALSENEEYLKNLEDDSSFNLNNEGTFFKSVRKVINDKGTVVYEKTNP